MILLRRLLPHMRGSSLLDGITVLAHATPHPDILWSPRNWISTPVKEEVQAAMHWSSSELVDGECFAIDPTGKHILEEKVRGKLLSVDSPKIALLTRGKVSADFRSLADTDGYTLVRPRKTRAAAPEYVNTIEEALLRLAPAWVEAAQNEAVAPTT